MPRFAATALGWTGGWARHPPHTDTPGQSHRRWAGQVGWEQVPQRATRTWGQVQWLSGLRTAPTSRAPHGSAGCPFLQPLGSPHSYTNQPQLTAWCLTATWNLTSYLEQGASQWPSPPSSELENLFSANCGAKGSSPLGRQPPPPPAHVPAPPPPPSQLGHLALAATPSHQALLACIPLTPHLTQGPCPQGLQGKLHPNSHPELL